MLSSLIWGSKVRQACQADIIFKVRPPSMNEVKHMREGTTLFSMIYPAQNENLVKKIQQKRITCFAMVPPSAREHVVSVLGNSRFVCRRREQASKGLTC